MVQHSPPTAGNAELLRIIRDILGVGIVYAREKSNSCSYIVGNEKGLRIRPLFFLIILKKKGGRYL